MLDQRVTEFLNDAVRHISVDHDDALETRLQGITTQFARAGRTGGMHAVYGDEFVKELRHRAQLIFAQLQRAIALFPPSSLDSLHAELVAAFINALRPQWTHINELAKQRVPQVGMGRDVLANLLGTVHGRINDEHRRLLQQYEKVDLYAFAEALKQHREKARASSGGITNYGNIGVLQTGAHSAATVTMNVNSEDRATLVHALDMVAKLFTDSHEIAQEHRRQMLEVVTMVKTAAQSNTPNESMLRGMFTVICGTLQALADSGPAMATLRAAALPFGITF